MPHIRTALQSSVLLQVQGATPQPAPPYDLPSPPLPRAQPVGRRHGTGPGAQAQTRRAKSTRAAGAETGAGKGVAGAHHDVGVAARLLLLHPLHHLLHLRPRLGQLVRVLDLRTNGRAGGVGGRVGGCMRAAGLRGAGQWAGGRPGAQLPPAIKHQQEDCRPLHASDSDGDRGGGDTAHPAQQGQRSAPGTA